LSCWRRFDPAYRQYYGVMARWDLGYDVPVGRAYHLDARHTLPFTIEARRYVSEVEGERIAWTSWKVRFQDVA
jgi:hypothetical protein